jgi:Tol biopolymer transport system component/DNA-binding winged helix-turn-helix (wHTH) protein
MPQRYEFAEFVLDPAESLLTRSGEPLKATPRLLALLEALLDRPGRLVDKQELLDRVWGGTNVTEANLTVQVSKLRRLLGEGGDRVFIETVPTRGYRFLVPVRAIDTEVAPRAPSPRLREGRGEGLVGAATAEGGAPVVDPAVAPVSTPGMPRRRASWVAAAVLVVSALAWVGYARGFRVPIGRATATPDTAATPSPVGSDEGSPAGGVTGTRSIVQALTRHVADDNEPAWSPDGRRVAFTSNRGSQLSLYLLDLDRPAAPPTRIATSGPARSPAWSPDGLRLAYLCQRGGQDDVCVIDLDGRHERVVAGDAHDEIDPAWAPDGARIAYSVVNGRTFELHVVEVSGAQPRRVGPDDWSAWEPAWSPDGKRLVVSRWRSAENFDLWIVPLDGGAPTPVAMSEGGEFDPAWSLDGRRIAYAMFDGIHVIDLATRPRRIDLPPLQTHTKLSQTGVNDRHPSWSPDGQALAIESGRDGNAEIYRVPAVSLADTPLILRQLTESLGADKDPVWSPDGARIAFASNRDGKYEIYVMTREGGGLERLTVNDDPDQRPTWAPDGRRIAFMREHPDGVTDIYVLDLATRQERLLTPQPGTDSEPAWSPDGRRIAFNTSRDGSFEIYTMRPDGSEQTNITRHPARDTYPAWSPDSREIVFASNRGAAHFTDNDLYIVDAEGKRAPRRLTHTPAWDAFPAWSPDGRWVAFVRSIIERHDILLVEVATGIERTLTREGVNEDTPSWSPDGRYITYFANPRGNADVYVQAVETDGKR